MLLKFVLSTSDYIEFSKEYLKKKSFLFKPYVFGIAVLVASVLTLTYDNKLSIGGIEETNQTIVYLVSFVFTLLILLGVIWIARSSLVNKYYKYYRQNRQLAGDRTIELGAEAILVNKDSKKSIIQRNAIVEIGETLNYIYLSLGKRKIMVIPKIAGINYQMISDWING